MAEFNEEYTITGPRGTKTGTTFVDTGASFTVVPKDVADQLGITPYRPETVDTNNGPVRWGVGRADVSIGGKPARNQDVFIAPANNPLAIGAETLQISGFKLRANAARARPFSPGRKSWRIAWDSRWTNASPEAAQTGTSPPRLACPRSTVWEP